MLLGKVDSMENFVICRLLQEGEIDKKILSGLIHHLVRMLKLM